MTALAPEPVVRMKRIIAAVGVGLAAVLALALLGAATLVTVAATTGADPGETFTAAPRVSAEINAFVQWDDDAGPLLRSVEPDTRDEVAAAWVGALASIDAALAGDTIAMETFFAGPALTRVQAQTHADSAARGPTWLDHRAQVWFYSIDGRILGLTVDSHGLLEVDGTAIDIENDYDIVLVLRDGFWRVVALVGRGNAT